MRNLRPRAAAVLPLLLLAACQKAPPPGWSGYAEGETVYIAAPVAGRLATLAVAAGDAVKAQQSLFTLDAGLERAADAEARARALSAQAQAADADKGKRREELAVTQAQLRQAIAQAEQARAELRRREGLASQGFIAPAQVDDQALAQQQALARVNELQAALATAKLPARADERESARALAAAAESGRAQTEWRLQQKQQLAPSDAAVTDVFYRPGEWVEAGQPVVALLPPANRKARFYVPETQLGGLKTGQAVRLQCDGCGAPIAAKITFIAAQAEYTPPVIYSNEQRAKLVFLVEARPVDAQEAVKLHPGQPLDVLSP
ncbi:HlyD family secretion protein [Pelomonas sp. KK5]|uniref:HlyD family secretion protein n=1 Tax=Pelomonas sp. KK5 TaxID=1855730 RepID=UPI00097C7B07|nr:HlyD family efflux transporter periplasmic adaptor subunit [Pelomonas sp. KK5]